jgi:hypothetical protein
MSRLVLIYHLPGEPGRTRAAIRRRLLRIGGVSVQSGVVALPETKSAVKQLRDIRAAITRLGGVAYLLRYDVVAGPTEWPALAAPGGKPGNPAMCLRSQQWSR